MKRLPNRFAVRAGVAVALAALLSVTTSLQAQISVGIGGAPADTFDVIPVAANWSTFNITGGSGTPEDNAAMDTAVQAVAGTSIITAVESNAGNPPGTSANSRWSSTGFYLQTRPTGNAATLLMATLRNDSGGDIVSMNINYDYVQRLAAPTAELIPGHRVYYSLTGEAGTWVPVGNFGDITAANFNVVQPISVPLSLAGTPWLGGSLMYLAFADDNSAPNDDAINTIDNFAVTAVVGGVTTCVAITNQSSSITVAERGLASFSISATGTPQTIQWYRNGAPIVGANNATYTIPSVVSPGDNNAQFFATVSNSICQATSVVATLTVTPDTTPPTVIRAVADADPTKVLLTFSEPLDPNLVNEGNFEIFVTGTEPMQEYNSFNATLINGTNVEVTTDARLAGVNYSIQMFDLRDASSGNNQITPNPLRVPLLATLELIGFDINNDWKYFIGSDIFGTGWETVGYDDSAWLSGPAGLGLDGSVNGVPILTTLPYTAMSEPAWFRKHFALPARTNGVVLTLRDVVEDGAVYYLNGQEVFRHNVSPGTLTYATRSTAAQVDPTPIQGPFNIPITNLVAGDNVLAVVVIQSGATSSDLELAVELRAVVTEFLSGPAKITAAPQSLTVNEGQNATFTVVAEGELPLNYQWRKGGVDLEGQTNSSLTFNPALPSNAGNYTVFVSNTLGSTNSPVATLTVNPDNTAPSFVSARASTNLTNITLTIFDTSGLNLASVQDVSHYDVHLTAGGGNLTILSAVLAANGSNVILTTSERVQSQDYTIVLNNIVDRAQAQNVVTPTTRAVGAGIVILAPDDVTLWRFDSSSNNLDGLGWQLPGFNDLAWLPGLAGFTTSNALEITTNGFELRTTNMLSPSSGGPPTTYYRVPFTFPGSVANAALQIVGVVDDGLVAYINGVEAGRLRMTNASPVSFTNFTTGGSPETADVHLPLETITLTNLSGLVQGNNLLAIELHQQNLTSSDAVLSIQLVAEIQTFGGGTVGPPVRITRTAVGGISQITISWTGGGTLQETSALLSGGATVWVPSSRLNGVPFIPPAGVPRFYRVAQ